MAKGKIDVAGLLAATIQIVDNDPERALHHTNLSSLQKAIIYQYSTDGGSNEFNQRVVRTKGITKHPMDILLDQTLSKLPDEPGICYRKLRLNFKELKVYSDSLVDRQPVTEHRFISTTRNPIVVNTMPGNAVFTIESKRGKSIRKLSKFEEESEVLFRPNSKFLVYSLLFEDGLYKINLIER
jgi:hypothetical protein